jgi:2-oxoglutarate ferredoxin oxidoreductase subunit beta
MRRNLPIIYIIEDNGCYGLTKGQFSPTADLGSKLKNGVVNDLPPIDTCALAIELGATFVARSFSGDKKQLLSILKAALSASRHRDARRHLAVRDLQRSRGLDQELRLREGSRRSARRGQLRAVLRGHRVDYEPGTTQEVTMHDGSGHDLCFI